MEGESDSSTAINLQKDSSDTMLGVELLTNGKGKSPELSVTSEIGGGGNSSGEESTKKEQATKPESIPKKTRSKK